MKNLFIIVMILSASFLLAENVVINNKSFEVNVISSDYTNTVLEYNFGAFEQTPIIIEGETYYQINLENGTQTYEQGAPSLPKITRSLIISDYADPNVTVIESDFVEFEMKVAPSKGKISRDIDPATVPFEFGNSYDVDSFFPRGITKTDSPYIMRDFRGTALTVYPFAYNHQTQTLRVYTHIVLEVNSDGTGGNNVRINPSEGYNKNFVQMYENHFINFTPTRYETIDERGRMIVISYGNFMDAMQPFVDWKNQKGIQTEMYNVADIGSNANSIKAFIQSEYDENDGLAFVQLVGDAAQMPSFTSGGGGADPKYALLEGNDSYPEIFVGRFSAENAADVETQVERTVHYERDLADGNWLAKGMGIGSSQGAGQGDDGESDWVHLDNIRDDLLGFTYTEVDQIYDTNGGNAGDVTSGLNEGRSIINYTGHGSNTSWSSTGFSNTHVNSLQNDYKLPYINSVACVNGNFVSTTCFAEAWLRATNNSTGAPTGAVAIYASSINQSWADPMSAQDEAVDLLCGSGPYDNQGTQMTTLGALWYNSSCLMLDEYNAVSMFETWHIFGDASLQVRSAAPSAFAVSHQPNIFIGAPTFDVSTGIENALVSLTNGDDFMAYGYTGATGNVSLSLDNLPTNPQDLTLTISGFNKITTTEIVALVPNSGAYVTVNNFTLDSRDGIIEPGETVILSVTLENVGSEDATDVSMNISSIDQYISITDADEDFGTISADGGTITITNAYTADVSFSVPNEHFINILCEITADEGNWQSAMDLQAVAPQIFDINTNEIEISVNPGDSDEVTLELSNYYPGSDDIEYSIAVMETDVRDMTGSYVECSASEFTPGETVEWIFSAFNGSNDSEWITDVNIDFPEGVTVNSSTDFSGGSGGDLTTDNATGNGAEVHWSDPDGGYGNVYPDETVTSIVNVSISPTFMGDVELEYSIQGDIWGDEPHNVSGTIEIESNGIPISWIVLDSYEGNLAGGETDEITITFDTADLEQGDYTCDLLIDDGLRNVTTIPVTLHVQPVDADDNNTPNIVSGIHGNSPNPFNPSTTINFGVSTKTFVTIDVFNAKGQKVKTLVNEEIQAGSHSIVWNGNDDSDKPVSSGVYFSKMNLNSAGSGGKYTSTKKMLLLK
jgi:hypothetical protein